MFLSFSEWSRGRGFGVKLPNCLVPRWFRRQQNMVKIYNLHGMTKLERVVPVVVIFNFVTIFP